MTEKDNCIICNGTGKNFESMCTFCNGTGEPNSTAEEYFTNHICQCDKWDRVFCPVCYSKCHHNSSQTPKQIIDSGFGGMANMKSEKKECEEEEMIIS